MTSIREALDALTRRHVQFIEANYHLWHPRLIMERRALIAEGEIASPAWVEGTPTYKRGRPFDALHLPGPVVDLLADLQSEGLVVKAPYEHQAEALREFFVQKKDLIVSTGTGSGKTEIFLYAILGMLAIESAQRRTPRMRSMRAIILYPMNALVADQLARLRKLLGSDRGAAALEKRFGRPIQFGMYTSRTHYHGRYDPDRNQRLVGRIIDYFVDLQRENPQLFRELKEKGKVPAKDLIGFRGGRARESRYHTQPTDTELFTRQEMHSPNEYGGPPDILITNYSMLEYMLLRPIEQPLFNATREWLAADPASQLLIVIDEAHLYRGAQGAEVALLIRRLLQHLRVDRSRVRFILSSASLGSSESAQAAGARFGADLTASRPEDFAVITGSRVQLEEGGPGNREIADILVGIQPPVRTSAVQSLARVLGWPTPVPADDTGLRVYLGQNLASLPVFRELFNKVTTGPVQLQSLSTKLFSGADPEVAREATLNLMHLGSQALREGEESLLPARVHIFFKGLPRQYVCINPRCSERRAKDGSELLGKMFTEPQFQCGCGARVFELLSHRTCGASYVRAFRRSSDRNLEAVFLWSEARPGPGFDELHILVEPPRSDPDLLSDPPVPLTDQIPPSYLDVRTGHLVRRVPAGHEDSFIGVWVPPRLSSVEPGKPWSWVRCPACGIRERVRPGGLTYVMDLETKGEEPFANLVKTLFQFQSPVPGRDNLPNNGRKVLCFSDGRQKAARLARDLQRTVERDSFREMIVDAASRLPPGTSMAHLFPSYLLQCNEYNVSFFDDGDQELEGYRGSRTHFVEVKADLQSIANDLELSLSDLRTDYDAARHLNKNRPRQYNSYHLRLLGDKHFSAYATLIGFVEPTKSVMKRLKEMNPRIDGKLLREILLEILRNALEERAFDPDIHAVDRRMSRATVGLPFGKERPEGECLRRDELIPDYLGKRLGGLLTAQDSDQLRRSLVKSGPGGTPPPLFGSAENARYAVNPEAVTFHLALEEPWHRCTGCRQFSPAGVNGLCPMCGGKLERVKSDDLHLSARKTLLRDPCLGVLLGTHRPFTLRSEEHSAQLSAKDNSEIFSKSETYELLFQDVITSENSREQPVDVLSCTTTMEVGIDIGSLTGAALRTVPPLPANYQQRSGRAGRRGAALSTIITFADNSPHEMYHFWHPELLIGAESAKPMIYTGNRKISERHINASIIQKFFQSAPIPSTADVFSSLGPSKAFFKDSGPYSLEAFEPWLTPQIESLESTLLMELGSLLPDALKGSLPYPAASWKEEFVRDTALSLLRSLHELADKGDWSDSTEEEDSLLSTLLDAGLRPTFSFPIDVCTFTVRDLDRVQKKVLTRYEMSQDLKQALSEYIPGRQIVVDKKTYTSYGIHTPFARSLVNRAQDLGWDTLEWLNYCPSCESVMKEKGRNLSLEGAVCEVPQCQSQIRSMPMLRPQGFSPEVDPSKGLREGEERETERVYASPARFPLPVGVKEIVEKENLRALKRGIVTKMPNQELLVINLGQEEEEERGFEVCTLCGAIGTLGKLAIQHNRPYPKDPRIPSREWRPQCAGSHIVVSFGYRFQTDLTVLRLEARRPLNFAFREEWFKAAARSLSEALVLGAARTLGIDTSELAGGTRIVPRYPDDIPDIAGYVDLFLYDTTPGGAGFAAMAFEAFHKILETTSNLLFDCKCGQSCHACLRTYDNRIWHNQLDRHLAFALLNFVRTGILPRADPNRNRQLLDRLSLSLRLMDSELQIDAPSSLNEGINVRHGDRSIEVRTRSCLLEPKPDRPGVLQFADYDFAHNLPLVAHRIKDAARGR